MTKQRLDIELTRRGLTRSRSQAESWIGLGKVTIDGRVATKAGQFVNVQADIKLTAEEQYVSRAGLKLASVAKLLKVDFQGKTVLDVGSSTGGFTDYALQHKAAMVYAVDVGTDQLHPSLQGNPRIELHEKTDIRDVYVRLSKPKSSKTASLRALDRAPASVKARAADVLEDLALTPSSGVDINIVPDIVVMDVSFISLREILPHIAENLSDTHTQIVAMLKPQFEAGRDQVNKGVIKNDAVRRQILKDFEVWAKRYFVIVDKRDSDVAGTKGNRERFYLLKIVK